MSNVVTAPDSLQPASINFSSLYEKAMAHTAGNDPVVSSTPDPIAPIPGIDVPGISAPATPDLASPAPIEVAPAVPAVSPAEAKILDLPDDALVRVKIDGKEEPISIKEFKDGISREAVFTKRMQSLAEQRKQAEAELATQYATLQQQAQAVEAMKAQFAEQFKAQTQPLPTTPQATAKPWDAGEIATMGDVQATLAAEIAKLQAESKAQQEQFVKALGEAGQQVQKDAALQRDAQLFTEGLTSVMAKPEFAVLKKLPYPEESLRYAVAAMEPKSIQEAVQFAEMTAKGWVDGLRADMVETAKRQEVAKAQAKLEPPTGSAPPPASQFKPGSSFDKSGKFNWDALRARADAMMG